MASADSAIASCSKTKSSHFHCCVPNCTSDGRYDDTLCFHRIPKDDALRKQWIVKIRRDEGPNFKISSQTVVCSKHFNKDDYKGWCNVRKKLKPNSVPSIFDWSSPKPPRRAIKRKQASPTKSAKKFCRKETEAEPAAVEICTETTDSFDFTAEPLDDLTAAKFKIEQLTKQLETAKSECEGLQQQLYRI